ncbi:unnamed protein product, partial [Rotaria sp. Silwood1]
YFLLLGEGARKLLSKLTQKERETFYEDVRTIYHTIAEYLKKNLPLRNSFLRDIQILHPSYRSVQYSDDIVRIARTVPGLLSDQEIDYTRDEWLNYSLEHIDETWYIKEKKKDYLGAEIVIYHRIDYYWNKVQINKEIIKSVQSSYLVYKQDLHFKKVAAERLEKENKENLKEAEICKEILNEEDELLLKQKTLQRELNDATSIIADASERLQLALKKKDSIEIDRSTILIHGGNTKSKEINEQLSKVTEELIKIQKKRKSKFSQQQQKRQKTLTDASIILN